MGGISFEIHEARIADLKAEIERLRLQLIGMKDELNLCHERLERESEARHGLPIGR